MQCNAVQLCRNSAIHIVHHTRNCTQLSKHVELHMHTITVAEYLAEAIIVHIFRPKAERQYTLSIRNIQLYLLYYFFKD